MSSPGTPGVEPGVFHLTANSLSTGRRSRSSRSTLARDELPSSQVVHGQCRSVRRQLDEVRRLASALGPEVLFLAVACERLDQRADDRAWHAGPARDLVRQRQSVFLDDLYAAADALAAPPLGEEDVGQIGRPRQVRRLLSLQLGLAVKLLQRHLHLLDRDVELSLANRR